MTTLELQTWKNLLAESILQTNNIDLLKAVENLIKKIAGTDKTIPARH